MEWCIPIDTFRIENVHLGPILRGGKPIVPLAYYDRDIRFPSLAILLPVLPVKSYDPTTGRLALDLSGSGQVLAKLQTFQDMLLTAVNSQYKVWYPAAQTKRPQDIRAGFQPILSQSELHLYCPIYENMTNAIPIYMNGEWIQGKPKAGSLVAGMRVRVAIRLCGISFQLHPETRAWTGRFRLQHKIIGVLIRQSVSRAHSY